MLRVNRDYQGAASDIKPATCRCVQLDSSALGSASICTHTQHGSATGAAAVPTSPEAERPQVVSKEAVRTRWVM
jgi:hypothetical protein